MNWWVWQFAFSRIQLPFLGEILIDISKNPSEQIQFSHSKSLKRSWGWQHYGLYFCVVLAKNSQASSINCHVFLLQIIIKERQDCWSWLVSVEKSKLWKRWNVFVHCRDDREMFFIIWKMTRTTLWAWFNMLSSQNRADYFDVTLVGDDSKYNLAHEVVLATSSHWKGCCRRQLCKRAMMLTLSSYLPVCRNVSIWPIFTEWWKC